MVRIFCKHDGGRTFVLMMLEMADNVDDYHDKHYENSEDNVEFNNFIKLNGWRLWCSY